MIPEKKALRMYGRSLKGFAGTIKKSLMEIIIRNLRPMKSKPAK